MHAWMGGWTNGQMTGWTGERVSREVSSGMNRGMDVWLELTHQNLLSIVSKNTGYGERLSGLNLC